MAERSKALDWNSSYISTGVRGFESHPLRQFMSYAAQLDPVVRIDGGSASRPAPLNLLPAPAAEGC